MQTYRDDTTYRFTAWVKAATENTRVRIYTFVLQNGQTTSPYWTGKTFTVGTDWQEISVTQYAPSGYDQVAVRLDNRDLGRTVYWDDLELVPLPNLFPNAGFEELKLPFTSVARGVLALDTAQKHKGTRSLKHTATGNDSYTLPYQGKGASLGKVSKGEVYTLSLWPVPMSTRRFNCVSSGSTLPISTPTACWETLPPKPIGKSSRWNTPFPTNVSYLSIRLDNDGGAGAVVWWDDFILEPKRVDSAAKVTFTSPVPRTLSAGDSIYMGNTHQRSENGWFAFEIPGNAVHLNWVQTQDRGNRAVRTRPDPERLCLHGRGQFTESAGTRSIRENQNQAQKQDFTAEFQFEVDGAPLSFFVNGTFNFVSWSMHVVGSGFDIELDDFGRDYFFDLEITNFDFSEELIIPVLDLTHTVWEYPLGIDTIFFVQGVQDPQGIDPNGVVLVQPGGVERIPITIRADAFAEAGAYELEFIGVARNGGTEVTELVGTFRRSGDLDINNIDVSVTFGPNISNNGFYDMPEALQASGESLSFDIKNFNTDPVIIQEPTITTVSAPDGSGLQFVPDGPISRILDPNGDIIVLSGSFDYDETNTTDGNFAIDITLLVTDTNGGITFSDFYSFTINGAIGSSNPCDGSAKRGSDVCEGPLLVRFTDDDVLSTEDPNPLGEFRAEYFDDPREVVTLKVRNVTQGVCIVQSATISGQGYSIPSGQFPMTLQSQEEQEFELIFDFESLNAATHTGTLTLTHDDGTVMTFTLSAVVKPFLGIRLSTEHGVSIDLSTPSGGSALDL